jgi:sec-independent protein translocase protein TatC
MAAEHIDPEFEEEAPRGYQGGPEMTLLEHLRELRNRVIICALALIIGCAICFYFWEPVLGWMLAPGRVKDPGLKLTSFSPTDRIGAIFKIGLYGGLAVASPVWIYELLAFIVPGLTPRERKLLLPGILGVVAFLLAGMAFAYWIILPNSLGFLLDFGNKQIENQQGIQQYVSFVTRIVFWVGVAFEMPIVLGLAARLGLVRAKQLLGFWRYAIIIIFIIAAIITPTPDPFNQTLVAAPLFFLYFVGILFAKLVQRPKPAVELAA